MFEHIKYQLKKLFRTKESKNKPKFTAGKLWYVKDLMERKFPDFYLALDYDPDEFDGFYDELGLLYLNKSNNGLYIKIETVSCYSDINGIKNYRGIIYKLCNQSVVIQTYTDGLKFAKEYHNGCYSYYDKKLKIDKRKLDLMRDFM